MAEERVEKVENISYVKTLSSYGAENVSPLIDKIKSARRAVEATKKDLDVLRDKILTKIHEQQEAQKQAEIEKANVEKEKQQKQEPKVEVVEVVETVVKETITETVETPVVEEVKAVEERSATEVKAVEVQPEPEQKKENVVRTYIPQQDARKTVQKGAKPAFDRPKTPISPNMRPNIVSRAKPEDMQKSSAPTKSAPSVSRTSAPTVALPKDNAKNFNASKKKDNRIDAVEKKGAMNKRTLIRKGFIEDDLIQEDRNGTRRYRMGKKTKQADQFTPAPVVIEKAVITTENLTVKMLSEKIGKTAADIVKHLFNLGIISNVNGNIDFDTAELIAAEYGIELELKLEKTYEEVLKNIHDDEGENEENLVTRPPVVTIMGHVDHGKTSLLDYIRHADVAAGEAGGITQHIGAYTVTLKGAPITFLDTPGHEAFTSMRERGAQVTDIAIIVVACDDGIMPQTIEAINHAKAANVPIIIAVNKMDKPGATADRIKQQLTEHDILPEEWGGDTIVVPVSAKTGMGVEQLLESVLLLAEIKELKANPKRSARGSIIEAKLDKGRGPLATVLVQNGTLRVSDFVVAGTAVGRIRAMIDDKGRSVKEAGPSVPVSVLGFSEVPNAGDQLMVVADEKLSKQVAEERKNKEKVEKAKSMAKLNLEEAFGRIGDGDRKELNLIIKADVQGSVEAIKQSVLKLTNDEVKINIIHGGVGAVNESDVILASSAHATIIGFNVRPDSNAKSLAEKKSIPIRTYRIIYDLIDDVSMAMKGMLAPKFSENIIGHAEVRMTFKITGVGTIAGSYVTDGKIARNCKLRLLRDNIIIYEGAVSSLKRMKDDAKEVATGYECGIGIEGYNDIKEGDVIEAFIMQQEEV